MRNSLTPANARADHSQQKEQSKVATFASRQLQLRKRKRETCRTPKHAGTDKNKDKGLSSQFTKMLY